MDKIKLHKNPDIYRDYAKMGKLDNQRIYMQLGIQTLYKYKESNNYLIPLNQSEIDSFTNQKVKFTTNQEG